MKTGSRNKATENLFLIPFFKLLSWEKQGVYAIYGALAREDTHISHLHHPKPKSIFQNYLLWVGELSDSPSWYIPAEQMPDRQHLSLLPEKKITENFCLHNFLSLLYFSNPTSKKPSENTKTFQIQSYFISRQDLLLFLFSPVVPHTIKQPVNWVFLILFICLKTTKNCEKPCQTGYLSHIFSLCSIYSSLGVFNCQVCFLDGKRNLPHLHSVPPSSLMCCSDNLIHICLSTNLRKKKTNQKCIEDKQEKRIILQYAKSSKRLKSRQICSWDTLSSTQFYYIQVTYAAHLVREVSYCLETRVKHKRAN